MIRYFRLYLYCVRFSISKSLQFRVDFFFRIFMDVVFYIVNILFYKVLYLHTGKLAGWRADQMMIFVCSYLLIDALHMTFFATNMWWLPQYINRGDLDYYLTRPVSALFFLSTREFAPNSFLNLLMALGLMGWALANYQDPLSLSNLIFFSLLILNGLMIHFLIQMLMIIPVFWTESAKGFNDFFFSMGVAIEKPDRIFRGWMRKLFTILLPFSLIASFPSRLFLDPWDGGLFFHLLGITIILWALMLYLWNKGLKAYSSASS